MKNQKMQFSIGIIIIIAMIFFGTFLQSKGANQPLHLITGLALGYILSRSRYGFAGGVKRIYMTGEGSLTRALLAMLAITLIVTVGIHWNAAQNGAEVAFRALEGQDIIPGTKNVNPVNLNLVIGGILFGIGMILGGGCASGTLTDTGEGEGRGLVTLIFFCIGGVLGEYSLPALNRTILGAGPKGVYLPDTFGYIGSLVLSFVVLGILYGITQSYESKRRRNGTAALEVEYEGSENPLPYPEEYHFFSSETFHKLFVERWSFMQGAVLLSMMFLFVLLTTGSNWGVSTPFGIWGVRVLQLAGVNPTAEGLLKISETASKGLLSHGGTVRNIGILFGSSIALLLAGRFKFNFNFTFKASLFYALGGFLMGFGARLAKGCNVGALYSAITSFSLSGWIFLAAMAIGGIIGLRLFEGKTDMVPNRNL